MLRTFSVTQAGALLLNSCPDGATIINLSPDTTVWIGSNPGTASGNGTPLKPLASFQKQGTSPLYADLDNAGPSSSAQVIITDEISGYDDPVALGAAIALRLAQTGVPNTITSVSITSNLNLAANASQSFNVSAYSTVTVTVTGTGGVVVGKELLYQFLDANNNVVDEDALAYEGRLAVSGPTLKITAGAASVVSITGTNRPPLFRCDTRMDTAYGDYWYLDQGGAIGSGTNGMSQNLTRGPQGASGPALAGSAFASFVFSPGGNTGLGVRFNLVMGLTGTKVVIPICDSAEMIATGLGGATKVLTKKIALPAGSYQVQINSSAAASSGVVAFCAFIPDSN